MILKPSQACCYAQLYASAVLLTLCASVTFHIINEALDYSPLMDCTSIDYAGRRNKAPCKIFEANDEDVPLTRYDWDTRSTTLRIDQTWSCEDPSSPNTQ